MRTDLQLLAAQTWFFSEESLRQGFEKDDTLHAGETHNMSSEKHINCYIPP